MGFYGPYWVFRATMCFISDYGFVWGIMGLYGRLWVGHYVFLRAIMCMYGRLCFFMGVNGFLMLIMAVKDRQQSSAPNLLKLT